MTRSYRIAFKPEQDGMGYFYGTLERGDEHHRIDLLPPKSEPKPFFVMSTEHMHDTDWIVYVDGEEIARVRHRHDIEQALIKALPQT